MTRRQNHIGILTSYPMAAIFFSGVIRKAFGQARWTRRRPGKFWLKSHRSFTLNLAGWCLFVMTRWSRRRSTPPKSHLAASRYQ